MTKYFDANRHLFVYRTQEDAKQAAKSFPLTVGIHVGCNVPATRTTPEVTSLQTASARAKELTDLYKFPVEMLPSGHTFSVLVDDVVGGDRNVYYLTKIHITKLNVDAWVVRGAYYEPFYIAMADCFWAD
jgi:hypothetical protein